MRAIVRVAGALVDTIILAVAAYGADNACPNIVFLMSDDQCTYRNGS